MVPEGFRGCYRRLLDGMNGWLELDFALNSKQWCPARRLQIRNDANEFTVDRKNTKSTLNNPKSYIQEISSRSSFVGNVYIGAGLP
jgi:hypothetical protein